MKPTHFNRLKVTLFGFVYAIMVATPVLAEDTEIFFGGSGLDDGVRPNVLFILDTSSSMTSTDGTGITRLDRMKGALDKILTDVTDINAGLMRFSRAGGPILYPINYIDKDVCEIESCIAGNAVQVRIAEGTDDAEEYSDGTVNLTSPTLEMVDDPTLTGGASTTIEIAIATGNDDLEEYTNNGSQTLSFTSTDLEFVNDGGKGEQQIGLRFQNVTVPQGATIISAELGFLIDENEGGDVSLDIYGHDNDNSSEFNNSNRVSTRISTASTDKVDWDNLPNPPIGNSLTSPNISSIVTTITNRTGWSSGNSMSFMLEHDPSTSPDGSNKRTVESFNGASAPVLSIVYQDESGGLADTDQTIGLRFQEVMIPQGVTITSAVLEFEVASTDTEATKLTLRGEDVDDAATFTTTNGDITNRNLTSSTSEVDWDNVTNWDTVDATQQSPDLSEIVQVIVDRTGWCGGNAMAFVITGSGKRSAKSYDLSSGSAPLLKIEYDPDTIPTSGGCMNRVITKTISSTSDDAEENISSGGIGTSSSDLEMFTDGSEQIIGLRFQNLTIPQGATIISANLEFEIDENGSGTLSASIAGQAHDDPETFSTTPNDISVRTKTAAVDWNSMDNPATNGKITTPDLSTIVQTIVGRSGWTSGNDMVFIIERASGSGKRVVESYNGETINAPRLNIIVEFNATTTTDTLITVRDRLKQQINELQYKSGTPIVDTLYEALLYYTGDNVLYGKVRGNNAATTNRSENTRVSHPGSYTGGSVTRGPDCTDMDLNNVACRSETITGSPLYTSPITESCQENFIILLTDGSPSSNESADEIQALPTVSGCANSGSSACGPELAKYMKGQDLIPNGILSADQNITTYTIGFNFSNQWIKDLAANGGGQFYEADSQEQLVAAFKLALADMLRTNTSFVSAGATVNQFNRLTHRNDIYFSLFRPNEDPHWPGNLKRYKLMGNPAELVDAGDAPAVDPSTGFFKEGARSYWSLEQDGNDVREGGAASQLSLTGRNVFTYTGTTPALDSSSNALSETNNAVTKAMLAISSEDDTYWDNLRRWARGVDLSDFDEDTDTTEIRKIFGDPLHSRPVIVTYGGTADNPDSTIFFGTNEGFVHAINAETGEEQFAFIPQELLPNLNIMYTNAEATKHPYGMDGSITAWVVPHATDTSPGAAPSGVYLYIGMRRGGRNYYALDVTDVTKPKLMWTIKGGTVGSEFEELGESWSRPIHTRINFNNADKEVLIFGGGYDDDQDSYTVRTEDTQGRAIFIVDALTGDLIWSGGPSTSFDEMFPDMEYSIPSTIRVIDINNDKLADQMYVGDMGGQVWRFDIHNGASNTSSLVTGGVIADINSGDDAAGNRRFYYEPDIALVTTGGDRFLSIAIGSGYRAHPLDTTIQDRFYMIRNSDIYGAPSSYTAIGEGDLLDVTGNLIGEGSTTDQSNEITALEAASGWRLTLRSSGEKVLAEAVTINNQIIFTTFEPGVRISRCSAVAGTGRYYLVNVRDATPVLNLDGTGNNEDLTASDREHGLTAGGIPPAPSILMPEGSKAIVCIGAECTEAPPNAYGFSRTYWRELQQE